MYAQERHYRGAVLLGDAPGVWASSKRPRAFEQLQPALIVLVGLCLILGLWLPAIPDRERQQGEKFLLLDTESTAQFLEHQSEMCRQKQPLCRGVQFLPILAILDVRVFLVLRFLWSLSYFLSGPG